MKKHILLTFIVAILLAWALDPLKELIITKCNYSPLSIVLSYVIALVVGVPVLLFLDNFRNKISKRNNAG